MSKSMSFIVQRKPVFKNESWWVDCTEPRNQQAAEATLKRVQEARPDIKYRIIKRTITDEVHSPRTSEGADGQAS